MNELQGSLGTSASLALRLGQAAFSVASLLFMCFNVEFYNYTSFCFLVTIMGLVIPWSMTLALVDACSVCFKLQSRQKVLILVILIGDWILSFLGLAAAVSVASLTDFFITFNSPFCILEGGGRLNLCNRYQLSAAMAFLSWSLSFASSLLNLWILPSLQL